MDHSKTPPPLHSHSRHKKTIPMVNFLDGPFELKNWIVETNTHSKRSFEWKNWIVETNTQQMNFPFQYNRIVETNGALIFRIWH